MAAEFTLVIPGKSTRVKLRTLGEKIFRFMASGLIPWKTRNVYQTISKQKKQILLSDPISRNLYTLLSPVPRFVSDSISLRIS